MAEADGAAEADGRQAEMVPAYDLAAGRLVQGSVTREDGLVVLGTASEAWAYTIVVPLERELVQPGDRLQVTLEAQVEVGALQIGIANEEGTDFRRSAMVGLGDWREVVLYTPPVERIGDLVIRNGSTLGASNARVRRLSVRRVRRDTARPNATDVAGQTRCDDVFDLQTPFPYRDGLLIADHNIVARMPPEAWAHALMWNRADAAPAELTNVRIVIRARARQGRCACLIWSGEKVLVETHLDESYGWQDLDFAVATLGPDAQVVIRNTDLPGEAVAEVSSLEVFVGYERAGDVELKNHFPDLSERAFVPRSYRTTPSFLVYQPGKVASITIERSIRASDPWAEVERLHFLNDALVARMSHLCAIETANRNMALSLQRQTDLARAVLSAIRRSTNPIRVITGFRDPLSMSISAFFQNLQYFCPSITCDPARLDADTETAIEEFKISFDALQTRRRERRQAETLRDFFLEKKLWNIGEWFDTELKSTLGFDLFAIDMGDRPYVHRTEGRFHYTIYRYEDLRTSLPDLLDELGLRCKIRTENYNIGEDKPIGKIYTSFREKFRPTPEMLDFYYSGPFFARFYRGRRPAFG